jgi:hypothetical protein
MQQTLAMESDHSPAHIRPFHFLCNLQMDPMSKRVKSHKGLLGTNALSLLDPLISLEENEVL